MARKKLSDAVPKRYGESTQVRTIYMVPDELKAGDYKYYHAVAVCLGGFCHLSHQRTWCKLEEYKWCCVRQLIAWHGLDVDSSEASELLHLCMESMNRLLPQVLVSYSQDIEFGHNDEMAEEMLLDGCFILHRLLKYAHPAIEREDDDWTQTFGRCWVWQSVTRDLLLLENQIPFFVVKELFKVLKNDGESEELLFTGGLRIFRSLRLQMRDLTDIERGNVHHLLHLFYLSVSFQHESSPSRPYRHEPDVFLPDLTQWIPSAKELEEAGVRFRKRRNAASFLDIRFDYRKGVLEIPPLQLYDSSSALFRNLIAFEQTYPAAQCDVSAYAVFMDCLVNTPEDMRILHLRGILVNQMNGEQDASRFFSQICAQVHFPADNYLASDNSRRHRWRAALVRNHFSDPWRVITLFAAMLLLALTMLQTFFTVYPYYKPSRRA